jgi:hypothetical protein
MLIGLKDHESKDEKQKQKADDLATLLDSIANETTDLTEVVFEEESLLEDMFLNGEDDLAWFDSGVFEGDDLESGLEAPDDSARAPATIDTEEQDSETKFDNQGEEEKMLTEKEVLSSEDDTAMIGMSNDGAAQGADKTPTGTATTPGAEDTIPFHDPMWKEQATEEFPTIDDQPSKNSSRDHQLVNEVEEQGDEGEKPTSDALPNELGTLLNKKIEAIASRLVEERMSAIVEPMNKRMEVIASRLVEERMPAIAEPIILDTIKKLLISI